MKQKRILYQNSLSESIKIVGWKLKIENILV